MDIPEDQALKTYGSLGARPQWEIVRKTPPPPKKMPLRFKLTELNLKLSFINQTTVPNILGCIAGGGGSCGG